MSHDSRIITQCVTENTFIDYHNFPLCAGANIIGRILSNNTFKGLNVSDNKLYVVGEFITEDATWNNALGIPYVVQNNEVEIGGYWKYIYFYDGTIDEKTIIKHCVVEYAGFNPNYGIYCVNSSPTIRACEIRHNAGLGICCYVNSSPLITNCILIDNLSSGYGGGIYCDSYSSPTIANCTITQNSADTAGGGMYCNESSPIITNCIIWDNAPDGIHLHESFPAVTYSDIQGGYSGTGNLDIDPLFVNPGLKDYHLHTDSPCIDAAGTNAVLDILSYKDKDNRIRPLDGDYNSTYICDMGAYEVEGPTLNE
ncbi:MAG: right-handed parallel beta-helix repeat-containing protein [bacterium]